MENGVGHMSTVTEQTHHMLDLLLVETDSLIDIENIQAQREASLQTNRFLVTCQINARCCREPRPVGPERRH